MTPEEIATAREWVHHYGPHLNTTGLEARNAIATARVCLDRLEADPENIAARAELKKTMTALRAYLQHRPVTPPLHPALAEGWFLPLDQLRSLGVRVYSSRSAGPRVRNKWSIFGPRRSR